MKKETIAIMSLFLVAFIWGSAFIAVDLALANGWQTFSILTVRGLVGGVVLLPFAIKNKFWKNKKSFIYGIVMGIFFYIAFYFQTEGQVRTTIGNSAFLTSMYVVFAPLVLKIFFKEKQTLKVYIGCLVAIIGIFFLTILGEGEGFSFNIGDILVLIGALFFALQIIVAQKSSDHCSPIESTPIMLITMGILSFFSMIITKESGVKFDATILPVLYCAIFSSAIASLTQITAQKYINSSKASIIMAQEALLATLMAAIYFKELPNVFVYIGGFLMLASVIIIEVNFMKKLELKHFKYILLDVDDTLLDFQKSQDESIKNAYNSKGITITNDILDVYKQINVQMWKDYEKNIITTNEIFGKRFDKLNEQYNFECDGTEIEKLFREELNNSYFILDNTIDFLEETKNDYELIIVTNGKKETQDSRLKLSGLDKYFKYIFISEEVGYKKPEIEFFKHIENTIENFDKSKAIIIGDSLTSDIQGGINYEIKTCHFNPSNIKISDKADYTISSLKEIICK